MSVFSYTLDTVPAGMGFSLFGHCHLLWLLAAAAFCVFLSLCYAHTGKTGRRRLRLAVAAGLLALELAKLILLLLWGTFRFWYLPLHLCSIGIFLVLLHALHPTPLLEELLYAVCLPGALSALLFPGWSALPFGSFLHLHSFLFHILLLAYPLMLLCAGELHPSLRRLPQCVAVLLGLCLLIYPINKLTHANFFFLNGPGSGNPLVWFYQKLGNPGYLLGFPVIAALVWLLLYALPPLLRGKRRC